MLLATYYLSVLSAARLTCGTKKEGIHLPPELMAYLNVVLVDPQQGFEVDFEAKLTDLIQDGTPELERAS